MEHMNALSSFLDSRRTNSKSGRNHMVATHLGTGGFSKGSFHVKDCERDELSVLMAKSILEGNPPSLTSHPRARDNMFPVKVDIDIHSDSGIRQFGEDHEKSLVSLVRDSIANNVNIPSVDSAEVFLSTREDALPNKDGVHIRIPGIRLDKRTHSAVRDDIILGAKKRFLEVEGLPKIHVSNTLDTLVDKSVQTGGSGFYIDGCVKPATDGKPECPPYKRMVMYVRKNGSEVGTRIPMSTEDELVWVIKNVCHDSKKPELSYDGLSKQAKAPANKLTPQKAKETVIPIGVVDEMRQIATNLPTESSDDLSEWLAVCYHLRNIDESLKGDWVTYSQKSKKWEDGDIAKWDECVSNCGKWKSVSSLRALRDKYKLPDASYAKRHEKAMVTLRGKNGLTYRGVACVAHDMLSDTHRNFTGDGKGWMVCENGLWSEDPNGAILSNKLSDESVGCVLSEMSKYIRSLSDNKENAHEIGATINAKGWLMGGVGKTNVVRECVSKFFDNGFQSRLDSNPLLLGMKDSVIEMGTGTVRPISPDDMLTMTTGHRLTFDDNSVNSLKQNELFVNEINTFVSDILPNDEIRSFTLRAMSSTLTGGNPDNAMIILTGDGSNGKSVLMDLFSRALGPMYCKPGRSSMITGGRAKTSETNSFLMSISKARAVVFQEPDSDKPINSAVIKEITGSDTMTSRDLWKKEASIRPQFTPWLQCNDLPPINDQSHGIRRRLYVVPFDVRFVDPESKKGLRPNERRMDKTITDKLDLWAPTFLGMLLTKHHEYEEIGLSPPSSVRDKTSSYISDNDEVEQFLKDAVVKKAKHNLRIGALNEAFLKWRQDHGIRKPPPTKAQLKRRAEPLLGPFNPSNGWSGKDVLDNYKTRFLDLSGNLLND